MSNVTFSIKHDILQTFKARFPASTRSNIIEGFMLDMCGFNPLIIDPNEDEEEQIAQLIKNASVQQHNAALELRALEIRRKQIVEMKEVQYKNKIVEQQKLDFANQEETFALKQIKENNELLRFKVAQEAAAKVGKIISAKEFVDNNFKVPVYNTESIR